MQESDNCKFSLLSNYSGPRDSRIKFLILHYTALSLEESLKILTQDQVSAHYVVPESPIGKRPIIYRLVPDHERAWHAGLSAWGGRTNLNDCSIGIEIVNRGYVEEPVKQWTPFTPYQVNILISLCQELIKTYGIQPHCILGHSDISPGRKFDPGPLFPWKELAEAGIGLWPDANRIQKKRTESIGSVLEIGSLQKDLKRYGYNLENSGILDEQTCAVIQAFHMHFMGSDSSEPTQETYMTLSALLDQRHMQS